MLDDLFDWNLRVAESIILAELHYRWKYSYRYCSISKCVETSLILGKLLSMKQSGIFFAPNFNEVIPR